MLVLQPLTDLCAGSLPTASWIVSLFFFYVKFVFRVNTVTFFKIIAWGFVLLHC